MGVAIETEVFMSTCASVSDLIGQVVVSIEKGEDRLDFTTSDGSRYRMYHEQDCCECVVLEDIIGDLDDLLDTPILLAEETTNYEEAKYESTTWTFYKFSTVKGDVTLRWNGSSNGYYSESVDFEKL